MFNYPFQFGSAQMAPMTLEDNSYLTSARGPAAAFSTAAMGMPQLPAVKDDKDSELYKKTKGKVDSAVSGAVDSLFGGGGTSAAGSSAAGSLAGAGGTGGLLDTLLSSLI